MSSEFTIDIQLTELGFPCFTPLEEDSVKETPLPPPQTSSTSSTVTVPAPKAPSAPPVKIHVDRRLIGLARQNTRAVPGALTTASAHEDASQSCQSNDRPQNLVRKTNINTPTSTRSNNVNKERPDSDNASKAQYNSIQHVTTIKNDSFDTKMFILQSNTTLPSKPKPGTTKKSIKAVGEGSREVREGENEGQGVGQSGDGKEQSGGENKISTDLSQKGTDELQKEEETDDSEVSEEDEEEDDDDDDDDDEDEAFASEMDGSGEHRCTVCDLTFPTGFLLREHMHVHSGARPYCCAECGKRFCHLANYRTHLRTHAQATAIRCRICEASFDTEQHLQLHLANSHFEKEFYQCDFCKRVFTCLMECQQHVDQHKRQFGQHACPQCGRRFRLRRTLRRHLQGHCCHLFTYLCSDCGQSFARKTALLRHSFSHLGLLPFTCIHCKRHFRLASLYRKHQCQPERIQCVACLGVFQSQADFRKHKKETGCWGYQGARPARKDEVRCMECGRSFASVEELKKHGGTHQRVLKCSECGMGFRSSLMLMSHMGGHAGQRPCLCQDCGLGFAHQQGYESHLKECGLKPPPVMAAKKLKVPPPALKERPIAPKMMLYPLKKAKPAPPSSKPLPPRCTEASVEVQMPPTGLTDQPEKASGGMWKLTLDKEPPPGVPLVMFLPIPASSSPALSDCSADPQAQTPSSVGPENLLVAMLDRAQAQGTAPENCPTSAPDPGVPPGVQENTEVPKVFRCKQDPDDLPQDLSTTPRRYALHKPGPSATPVMKAEPKYPTVVEETASTWGNALTPLSNGDENKWTISQSKTKPGSRQDARTMMFEERQEVGNVELKQKQDVVSQDQSKEEGKNEFLFNFTRTKTERDMDAVSQIKTGSLSPVCTETRLGFVQIKQEANVSDPHYRKQDCSRVWVPSDLTLIEKVKEMDVVGVEVKGEKMEETQWSKVKAGSHSFAASEMTFDVTQIKKEPDSWDADRAKQDDHSRPVVSTDTKQEMETSVTGVDVKSEGGVRGSCAFGLVAEMEQKEDGSRYNSVEVEIGDEQKSEAEEEPPHECLTCGQILLEADMVQHYMQHAVESDTPHTEWETLSFSCSPSSSPSHSLSPSSSPSLSPPVSPPIKRLRPHTRL